MIHGLLDRVMQLLEVPPAADSSGYHIQQVGVLVEVVLVAVVLVVVLVVLVVVLAVAVVLVVLLVVVLVVMLMQVPPGL